ncbi:hypothetical protein L2E82_14008 [Cichorium intybus]|uniref:Uncharacterized protein n=1 Tax=Cichorium intybus TaxID=13427 RepID=A0ACB9EZF0_CICIN|nr:hypothetical protein L2E82_14008 [Cichorium intybus]
MASTAQRKGSRRDPSWKYGVEIEVPDQKKGYKYLKCNFCNKIITGGVKRMKEHLACTHKDVAPCAKVPIEVKDEIKQYLKNFASTKIALQQNFKERVDYVTCSVSSNGSCENSMEDTNSSHSGSSRGIREPMDRFMKSKEDDEYERMMAGENMTPMSAKEHRNKVCLDIGRFFFENGIPFNCATSPPFINMLRSIGNYGCELKAPTMHEMKTWILKEEGLFGYKASLISYMTRSPVIWWDHFGDEVPELKRFATKILGLTCSASVCERDWNTLNQVHTKKRNNLSNDEMNKKMYIMYNEKLKQKFLKKSSLKEEDDPLLVENVSSDDEWIANPYDDEGESVTSRKRKNVKVELVDEDDDVAMACV